MKRRLMPPAYLLIFIVVAVVLHVIIPITNVVPMRFLGIAPLALGVGITLWADQLFKMYKTTVKPTEKSTKLITEGIFRYSRHPMYLGFVLILIAVAMLLGSLSALVAPILMAVTLETKFIPGEEKKMKKLFGKEYERYQNQVRKWI